MFYLNKTMEGSNKQGTSHVNNSTTQTWNNATVYLQQEDKIPTDPNDLPNFMRLMEIDPDKLYLMPIESYQKQYTQLCYDKLPLVSSTPDNTIINTNNNNNNNNQKKSLSIDIRNIVMTIILHDYYDSTKLYNISLPALRKNLLEYGVTYNRKKFKDVQLSLAEPFNLSAFIFSRGQLDFKGGTSLLRVYLTAEFLLSKFRSIFGERAFKITSKSIKNIVSTSEFDFCPSTDELAKAYPNSLSKVTNEKFPGAHFTMSDPVKGTNIVFLIFDNPKVICVGANNFENMRMAFEDFYQKAKSLPPFDPNLHGKKRKRNVRSKKQNANTTNISSLKIVSDAPKRIYKKRRQYIKKDEDEIAIIEEGGEKNTNSNVK